MVDKTYPITSAAQTFEIGEHIVDVSPWGFEVYEVVNGVKTRIEENESE